MKSESRWMCRQPDGHGEWEVGCEAGAEGNLEESPFCPIAEPGAGVNDGRGDIREESLEGETLREDGPLMLSCKRQISAQQAHRAKRNLRMILGNIWLRL